MALEPITLRRTPRKPKLTPNQVRGFWAAWGGWALDGMDSFIYALVLVPALRELLPRSGIPNSTAEIGFYGGLLFAFFLIGWGFSSLWGPVADRFGRVRTLMLTILCYSLFTFLGAFATNVWNLGLFRLLSGVGVGGEWAMATTFVAEEWPEERRTEGMGYLNTAFPVGTFLAALANYVIGARYGWRAMFIFGGIPALLVAFIRYGVTEPQRWQNRMEQLGQNWRLRDAFLALFSQEYRRRTMVISTLVTISMIGYWAATAYVPASVSQLAARNGLSNTQAAQLASHATMLMSIGAVLAYLLSPRLADTFGRRGALAIYFFLFFFFIAFGFGYVFYLGQNALPWFIACVFFLGMASGTFAVYTIWVPEQYRTECRASAFAFATSVGRFVAAGATFLVGAGVSHFGTIGIPIALTSLVFLVGFLLLPLGEETKGKVLPA